MLSFSQALTAYASRSIFHPLELKSVSEQLSFMVMFDRLSALPDSLLSVILCKLPIRDAIRCSVLSTRWRFLYTDMPQLLLTPAGLLATDRQDDPPSVAALENIISHILHLHTSDLDTLLVCTGDLEPWNSILLCQFTHQTLWEWLQCVARKNVKRLFLKCSDNMEIPPPVLFSCTRLTTLTLYDYILTDFPTIFHGFKLLTECTLIDTEMTDDSLASFLSLCPLLHRFNLRYCTGLQRPVISALNITYLNLHCCDGEGWTVNCPNLKTLKTCTTDLKVSGIGFQQLSPSVAGLEMELGNNLIALSLKSTFLSHTLSANRVLKIVGGFISVKALTIDHGPGFLQVKRTVVPLFKLLSRLPNLERFHLLGDLILERDPIPPSSMSPLPNLQSVEMHISKCDERELHLLGCLLQIAPALKEVKLKPALNCNNELYSLFLEKWQSLKQGREQGNLTEETICEFSFSF